MIRGNTRLADYERGTAQRVSISSAFSLLQLYPQPMRRQPSVEYVPAPYRSAVTRLSHPPPWKDETFIAAHSFLSLVLPWFTARQIDLLR
jgi:hypothetical protein